MSPIASAMYTFVIDFVFSFWPLEYISDARAKRKPIMRQAGASVRSEYIAIAGKLIISPAIVPKTFFMLLAIRICAGRASDKRISSETRVVFRFFSLPDSFLNAMLPMAVRKSHAARIIPKESSFPKNVMRSSLIKTTCAMNEVMPISVTAGRIFRMNFL